MAFDYIERERVYRLFNTEVGVLIITAQRRKTPKTGGSGSILSLNTQLPFPSGFMFFPHFLSDVFCIKYRKNNQERVP